MASQFGLQTGNQYFPQPVQSDLSGNLLKGAESAQRLMQLKAQEDRTKLYEQQIQQQQEQADVEKAREIYDTWQVNMPVDPTKPEESIVQVFKALPELEKSLASAFPQGVPPTIQMGVDSIKRGDPGPVLQGMYEYRNKLVGAKPQQTPEQVFQKSYNQQAGTNLANIELPVPSKEGQIKIGTRDTQQVGTQVQTIEYQGPEKGWVPVEGVVGPKFNPNTWAGGASGEEGIDIEAMANAVEEQSLSTAQIPKRGSIWMKVVSRVKEKNPKFNLMYNDANYKWFTSARGTSTINMLNGSLPRVAALYSQIDELPNTSLNSWNAFKRAVVTELGYQDYSAFEANRNAIVQEVNAAISGTSQASDLRVKIELENLKTSRSPEQLRAATENLYEALTARLDSSMAGPFPPEVVNGNLSMDKYRKEITEKYKGNYDRYPDRRWKQQTGAQPASGGQPGQKTVVGTGTDPDTGRPVNRYSDGSVEYADE